MAAEILANGGASVLVAEAKPSFGRKFLMAGKSGLNLTKAEPLDAFQTHYDGDWLAPMVAAFGPDAVQDWARGLGQTLFTGSTGRVFPTVMKASPLLRAWLRRLEAAGVTLRTRWRWTGWDVAGALCFDTPEGPQRVAPKATILALGGASWARLGSDGAWAGLLAARGVTIAPFAASNAGVDVGWSAHMAPHFGTALKSVAWRAGGLHSRGEGVLSERGLEGGGIYPLAPALRSGAALTVDLVPDMSARALTERLAGKPARLRLSHWLRNELRLPPVKIALFNEAYAGAGLARNNWVSAVKEVPVAYSGLRPLDEAISTTGGVTQAALEDTLELRALPGVWCAGEMLDWDAPTGGYLLTAAFATGRWAGQAVHRRLQSGAR